MHRTAIGSLGSVQTMIGMKRRAFTNILQIKLPLPTVIHQSSSINLKGRKSGVWHYRLTNDKLHCATKNSKPIAAERTCNLQQMLHHNFWQIDSGLDLIPSIKSCLRHQFCQIHFLIIFFYFVLRNNYLAVFQFLERTNMIIISTFDFSFGKG